MGKRGALTSFLWKVITPCSSPVPSSSNRVFTHVAGQSLQPPRRALGETLRREQGGNCKALGRPLPLALTGLVALGLVLSG